MKILGEYPNHDSFAEIYQTVGLSFFFVLEDGDILNPQHNPIVCRDFLNDAVTSTHLKKNLGSIFGFKLDGSKTPICVDKVQLVLGFGEGANFESFENIFHILNDMEHHLGWELSTFEDVKVDNSKKHIYVKGNWRWVQNPLMISIYTHILRMFACKTEKTDNFEDLSQVIANGNFGTNTTYSQAYVASDLNLLKFLSFSDRIFKKSNLWGDISQKEVSLGTLHNYSGFQTLISCFKNGGGDSLCSDWAREALKLMKVE